MGCMCGRKKTKAGEEDDFDVIDTSHPDSAKKADVSSSQNKKSPSRRGLSRLFTSKKSVQQQTEEKSSTSEEEVEEEVHDAFADGPPPTTSYKAPKSFQPSKLESRVTERTIETDTSGMSSHVRTGKKQDPATAPPPARESAFHGPPRFDWIDIVSIISSKDKFSEPDLLCNHTH